MGEPTPNQSGVLPAEHIGREEVSGGTETSQYPEEKKSTEIPGVVASEMGIAQTLVAEWPGGLCHQGVVRRTRGSPSDRKESETRFLAEGTWKGPPKRVRAP